MKSIAADELQYLDFLKKSITFRIPSGLLIYFLQISVFYLLLNMKELKERMTREASLTALLREAELNNLRAQIKPHFLFNSLNSVSALTMTDPSKAQDMVIKLSEFMRYSLAMGEEAMSTLENELYHSGLYMDIEKIRFSDRLVIEEEINASCSDWPVPAMILQPLLENAVKHGVYTISGPSSIRLCVNCTTEYLHVSISNNYDKEAAPRKGTGTGLQNVKSRLAAIYGRHDLLTITMQEAYFAVVLRFPAFRS
jgi:LytS/YehU family sensor histidine kinase